MEYNLDKLPLNGQGIVKSILEIPIKRRLLDIGLTKGTKVKKVMKNIGGNMFAYVIRGALIAIRNEDAKNVLIEVSNSE